MPSVAQRGRTSPAPLPEAGQMAPKMSAEAVLWSLGAEGRVPRLAQRRVIPAFAGTSLVLLPDPRLIGEPDLDQLAASFGLRGFLQTGGEVFLNADTAASLFA